MDKLAFCILGIAQGTCRLDGSHQIWQYVMRGEIKINASHQATLTLYQMACLASLVRSRWDGLHLPVTCSSNRTRRGPSRPGRLLLSTLRRASLSSGGTTCTVLADCCIGPGPACGATCISWCEFIISLLLHTCGVCVIGRFEEVAEVAAKAACVGDVPVVIS